MSERCVHLLLSGRVQGVGFRAFAAQQARQLGITGWIRNLDDGRVEVMAHGARDAIEQLVDRLREGPPLSRVEECLVTEERVPPSHAGFEVRY